MVGKVDSGFMDLEAIKNITACVDTICVATCHDVGFQELKPVVQVGGPVDTVNPVSNRVPAQLVLLAADISDYIESIFWIGGTESRHESLPNGVNAVGANRIRVGVGGPAEILRFPAVR